MQPYSPTNKGTGSRPALYSSCNFESEMPRSLQVSNLPTSRLVTRFSITMPLSAFGMCVPTSLAARNSKDSKHGQMGVSRTPRWHHLPAVFVPLVRRVPSRFGVKICMCLPSAHGPQTHTCSREARAPDNKTAPKPPNISAGLQQIGLSFTTTVQNAGSVLSIYAASGISRDGRERVRRLAFIMG